MNRLVPFATALVLLVSVPTYAKTKAAAPSKRAAPAKVAKAAKAVDPATFSAGPFRPFRKLLGKAVVDVKKHFDLLKGKAQDAWTVMVRGLGRLFYHAYKAVGLKGLGLRSTMLAVYRSVLQAYAKGGPALEKGGVRWVFGRVGRFFRRIRYVLRKTGDKAAQFAQSLRAASKKLRDLVKSVLAGKAEWTLGTAKRLLAGLAKELGTAFGQSQAKLQAALAQAKGLFAKAFKGLAASFFQETDPLLGKYARQFWKQRKQLQTWWERFKGGESAAHRALLRAVGAIQRRLERLKVPSTEGAAMLLHQALVSGVEKGLSLGKGLGKRLTDAVARWEGIFGKTLGTSGVGALLKASLAAVLKSVSALAAGKAEDAPGQVRKWLGGLRKVRSLRPVVQAAWKASVTKAAQAKFQKEFETLLAAFK